MRALAFCVEQIRKKTKKKTEMRNWPRISDGEIDWVAWNYY